MHHVDGYGDRGAGGTLADAALEHVEPSLLHRELDVHCVPVVLVELQRDLRELIVNCLVRVSQGGDRCWRARARYDVLALSVNQILAPDLRIARHGVPRERDAGAGIVAHIAEHHHLHGDGGTEVVGDVLDPPIVDGPRVVPRAEDGANGQLKLLHGIVRELAARLGLHQRPRTLGDFLQRVRRHGRIGVDARLLFRLVEDRVELGTVDLEHNVAEHHDEATQGVIPEARVARLGDEAFERLVVQPQVQDRIHHARHRELGAGADGDEQRVLRIAELLAGLVFDLLERSPDLL